LADLFLAAAYFGGLPAWHDWVNTRQRWQAVLALFSAISNAFIKDQGVIFSLTFIQALAITYMARREAAKLYVLFLLVLVLLWLLVPQELVVAGCTYPGLP